MSFDVDVSCPTCGHGFSANYTSNMGAFFAWALDGVESADPAARCDSRDALLGRAPRNGLKMLDGLSAEAAAEKLRVALARIGSAPEEELERFDAPNGWGTHGRATDFLRSIQRACEERPGGKVSVSW